MAKEIYLLYEADSRLSTDSMVLMGVYDNVDSLGEGVRKLARTRLENDINAYCSYDDESLEEARKLTGDERDEEINGIVEQVEEEFFENDWQTQSYDTNIYATTTFLNELDKNGIR